MEVDVVGLGVSTIDVISVVDRLPLGETVDMAAVDPFPSGEIVKDATDLTVQGGGPVATAMVTLARLGARTAMLDVVGDDWRGELIRKEFEDDGVCSDFVKFGVGCASGTSRIFVRKNDGERAIMHFRGTALELSPADIPCSLIQSAKYVHVNGRHWEACLHAVERRRDDEEHQVASRADSGQRGVAQPRDEEKVDEIIERLHQHADGNRRGRQQDMPVDGAFGQVLHDGISESNRPRPRRARPGILE